jgi:general secretion pathway protein G
MRTGKGFTLVEILIVVVILGVLAAIVIPEFTGASVEAKDASLASNLRAMRSQIELYKVQHNDALPGAGGATFVQSMTGKTDISGNVGADYGPYIKKIPANPFSDLATVEEEAGALGLGDGTHGWHFDTTTGTFSADDSAAHAAL